ncbi:MAG TPA: hypothetical protein VGH33_19730 [Isosphaeraceae bacterium]
MPPKFGPRRGSGAEIDLDLFSPFGPTVLAGFRAIDKSQPGPAARPEKVVGVNSTDLEEFSGFPSRFLSEDVDKKISE